MELDLPVRVSSDLQVTIEKPGELTPDQALRLAEDLTLKAMLKRAAEMPRRRAQLLRGRRTGAA